MGIFSWIGSAAKSVAKAVGIDMTPSGIISGVEKLAGVVAEAVPVVGPIVSHALPVLDSIFGSAERTTTENSEFEISRFMEGQKAVTDMINNIRDAVDKSRQEVLSAVDAAADKIISYTERKDLEKYYQVLDAAMDFFKTNGEVLASLTPDKGHEVISTFVTVTDNTTDLQARRIELEKQAAGIRGLLANKLEKKDSRMTAEYVDLLMLTTTWLMVYDKAVLHLRGYLAKGYLLSNDIPNYIVCMSKWNIEFSQTRAHANTAIQFLLGENVGVSSTYDEKRPGYLYKLREARSSADTIKLDDQNVSITDAWAPTGFGYAGTGKGAGALVMTRGEISEDVFKKTCLTLYETVNLEYFDVCAQRIVDIARTWQDCLVKWNSRLPCSPPNKDQEGKQIKHIVPTPVPASSHEDFRGEKEGYPKNTTVRYAVSYVTSQGEGFLSEWSTVKNLDENAPCVKLAFEPVMRLNDPFSKYDPLIGDSAAGPLGQSLGIMRRVYVRYTLQGQAPKDAWLGDLMPKENELTDLGVESHGKLNQTSLVLNSGSGGITISSDLANRRQ